MLVTLYADPSCAWSFAAYSWLDEARQHRDVACHLRPFSLLLRDGVDNLPQPVQAARLSAQHAMRVLAGLSGTDGWVVYGELCRPIYAAMAAGQLPRPDIGAALLAAGLPGELSDLADDPAQDDQILASMAEVTKVLPGTVLATQRIPVMSLTTDNRVRAWTGPLLDPVPTDAVGLWDALTVLDATPGFFELSRPWVQPHSLIGRTRN